MENNVQIGAMLLLWAVVFFGAGWVFRDFFGRPARKKYKLKRPKKLRVMPWKFDLRV
jgi:hypothetical protein